MIYGSRRFAFAVFLKLSKVRAGAGSDLIPIVPEVHATLHLLGRTDVSAWVSRRAEHSGGFA